MPAPRDAALVALAEAWRRADPDPATAAQVGEMIEARDLVGLAQAFGQRLHFGTAGLRAEVGPGPAHMNSLVVRQTAAGLASYMRQALGQACGEVVVGFDGRTDSAHFADDVIGCLAAAGLRVLRFDRPVPTPQVGFVVRRRGGAAVGVVVTASHNPPAYNGIKVYWNDGVQLVPPHDQGIAQAIAQGASQRLAPAWLAAAQRPDSAVATDDGSLEDAYLAAIAPPPEDDPQADAEADAEADDTAPTGRSAGPTPAAVSPAGRAGHVDGRAAFTVAYSPLHGVGLPWVARGLGHLGFTGLHTVAAQAQPDGRFPTLPAPNPEEPGAMRAVVALAEQVGAQLALATDPDADRLAVAAPTADGWRQLTGDEIGALFADFLLPRAPHHAVVASTLVSSPLLGHMAKQAGVVHFCTPTGFKWLAQGMRRAQQAGLAPCLAYEEALGFCLGEVVWDKDGVAALLAFVEIAYFWRRRGQSLWDRLASIAGRFGLFVSSQKTVTGAAAAAFAGERLRASPPSHIGGRPVTQIRDLLRTPWRAPEVDTVYPASDVLMYSLGDGGASHDRNVEVVVRPSGTEPKVKCYYTLATPCSDPENFFKLDSEARRRLQRLADCHIHDTSLSI